MWWRALGVKSTDDKETVKKAYAALIKTIDQDLDIDTFTKVHSAYRMAMKSFAKEEAITPTGLIDYEGQVHWYLEELNKIYTNPKRRLNTSAWNNLFACMSFIEEKHFLAGYVTFFNEHYALTDEIWELVDKYYPLSNRKEFLWPELVKGFLRIKAKEIEGLPFDEASAYVTDKIHAYYALLDEDYEKAQICLLKLMKDHSSDDLNRWYLVTVIQIGSSDDVEAAYRRMKASEVGCFLSNYLYAGHLYRAGDYQGAQNILSEIPAQDIRDYMQTLMDDSHYQVSTQLTEAVKKMPWNVLETVSSKKLKLLSKGNYHKASQADDGGILMKLWGGR